MSETTVSILASAGKTCVVTLACTMVNSLLLSRSAAEPTFANGVTQGTVIADDINEDSGMTVSRHNEGVLWVHNDHGDSARIFAVNAQAEYLGAFDLSGAGANDYEDLAIGRGPAAGVNYLYVGDIGDNDATGSGLVTVYRLPEPAVYAARGDQSRPIRGSSVDRLTLEYPDGPHNAETLMFDPLSGDLLIATKETDKTRVYRASAGDLADPALDVVPLNLLARTDDIEMSTAGDISPTGGEVIIKNYTDARIWTRWPGESVGEAMTRSPAVIPLQEEPMGEAIAFDAVGSGYFTHSENGGIPGGSGPSQPLYYYGRTSDDGPAAPLTLVSAGAPWKYLDDGSDQGTRWRNDPDFDDSSWQTGEGQFGYGDGDEWTTVAYGDDPDKKLITTYFRKEFEVDDPTEIHDLILRMVYDDGAAVYLNGTEIARPNLAETAAFDHLADETQSLLEDTWFEFLVDPGLLPDLLLDGTNALGVEVHQASPTSSDISFDLQLLATAQATLEPLTWDNQGGDFNWVTAANWNPDQVPDKYAKITIDNGDTVLLDSPAQEARSVTLESGTLAIAAGGELSLTDDMTVAGGCTLTGSGAVTTSTPITVELGGTISPGDGVGTFSVSSVELQPGSALSVELSGSGLGDRLDLAGE
ncbi:MAG: hypothetical protein HQ567_23435, partial [Candidatus Nealsonbacteria bacterium]|nr:hypothetical protein [Candidatus Nealsonbacteria bacterium]